MNATPCALQLPCPPPLSLYVHWPWCLKKCPYCDFNSHEIRTAELPVHRYLDALIADLDAALPLVRGRTVNSVFFGGGTPSLIPALAMEELLGSLRARLNLAPNCEITLESNPGTFEKESYQAFRTSGITRLSIGIQSFHDEFLQSLGRVHDREQALAAASEATQIFDTFNLDLMYALPGQTLDDVRQDVSTALSLAPSHLSIYHLSIEPHTLFAKYPPQLPDDDTAADMLDLITNMTDEAGMPRYEVSAYAKPGHACQHNLNYWQFGDYLGIGAGAHSKLSFANRVLRQVRFSEPLQYMREALSGQGVSQENEVSAADLPFEFMLNALRLKDGFSLALFENRTGLALTAIQHSLEAAERQGLLERDGTFVKPTARGFDFLCDLQLLFLNQSDSDIHPR